MSGSVTALPSTETIVDAVYSRLAAYGHRTAVIWRDKAVSYRDFCLEIDAWQGVLSEHGVKSGSICAFLGDYSPKTCALFFALMRMRAIAVPFTPASEPEMHNLMPIAGAEMLIRFAPDDSYQIASLVSVPVNPLIETFRRICRPGLIVFTSGSTGRPKAILHDCERVLAKFATPRRGWRTVLFLMMDHFGGFNTLLATFTNGGTAICADQRTPDSVGRAIEQSRADLLPTTPTFLNMLLATGTWRNYDMTSVELITYGTELMPDATLAKIRLAFPKAEVKQTYGLSELGVLRSQSPDKDSLWLRIGGDGFETKVVDNTLWIRSSASMVGYLNAPSPIDEDGWMNTGDQVELKDGLIRFLGRKNEVINVGGQKVFPIEVETVLLDADNVNEATVYGTSHPLLGQVVCARVSLKQPEPADSAAERLRRICRERLAKFKVPMRIQVVDAAEQASSRFKKVRNFSPDEAV